jgi:hypothetical protein
VNDQKGGRNQRLPGESRRAWLALCLWAIFAAGLAIQLVAPRLKIENHAFVMPPISDAQAATLRPDVLVRRERWMQGASGLLTVGRAAGMRGAELSFRKTPWPKVRSVRSATNLQLTKTRESGARVRPFP